MVFAARLTQRGHRIATMDDLMALYEKSFSENTVAAISGLPHPTVQKFAVITVVPDNGNMQTKELEDMVKEVNATQVAPEDLLSDKVQYYDRAAKTLGRKQEKGLLERLSENKAQVQEREAKAPKERQKTKQEPSL